MRNRCQRGLEACSNLTDPRIGHNGTWGRPCEEGCWHVMQNDWGGAVFPAFTSLSLTPHLGCPWSKKHTHGGGSLVISERSPVWREREYTRGDEAQDPKLNHQCSPATGTERGRVCLCTLPYASRDGPASLKLEEAGQERYRLELYCGLFFCSLGLTGTSTSRSISP